MSEKLLLSRLIGSSNTKVVEKVVLSQALTEQEKKLALSKIHQKSISSAKKNSIVVVLLDVKM